MPSDPLVLGFDTSAAHCAAALLIGDRIVDSRAEPMPRGQAERLIPMLAEMLDAAGLAWRDLDALGVGVGPGNFTGIRISVSAARGLALGLGRPAVGVSALEARARLGPAGTIPAIPGPRDQVYVDLPGRGPSLVAAHTAAALGPPQPGIAPAALAGAIARIAAERLHRAVQPPVPLYVRPADAAPAAHAAPPLLDE